MNDWVNNREAGDLRRYHAHYGVIVMLWVYTPTNKPTNTPTNKEHPESADFRNV